MALRTAFRLLISASQITTFVRLFVCGGVNNFLINKGWCACVRQHTRSYLKKPEKCHSVPKGCLRETERSGVNAEGIPSGESMTITHRESTRLRCRGCFVRLRRTQHDINKCLLHQTIFEMASIYFFPAICDRVSNDNPTVR